MIPAEVRKENIKNYFKLRFTTDEIEIHALGWISRVGEDTEYTGGFLLPVAIDKVCNFITQRVVLLNVRSLHWIN